MWRLALRRFGAAPFVYRKRDLKTGAKCGRIDNLSISRQLRGRQGSDADLGPGGRNLHSHSPLPESGRVGQGGRHLARSVAKESFVFEGGVS
jgi:hypothetical protein